MSSKKNIIVMNVVFLLALVIQNADSATYYVDRNNPSASDSNPGSEAQPWLTIRHAADVAVGGDIIIVRSGTYNERAVPKNSGGPSGKIIFIAQPRRSVTMWGFYTVNCSYLRIEGFNITTDSSLTDWTEGGGVFIRSDNVEVIDNYFYDIDGSAIYGYWHDPPPDAAYIANNKIYKCQAGIMINGNNWIVECNEVERLFQYGQGDCDYARFFGENHVIRGNYFHGTNFDEIGDAHVDCFQTFTNNGEHAYNILFENNVCNDFHQGLMAENNQNTNTSNFTFRNNIFAHGLSWGICVHQVCNVLVENNTFADIQYHGAGFRDGSIGNVIRNNIFYKISSSYWAADGGEVEGDYNLIYDASHPAVMGVHNVLDADPYFADPENNDFHLQPGSPAIDHGQILLNVRYDVEGHRRPFGFGWDIGAYEYGSGYDGATNALSRFTLYQNNPNPFNPSTKITFVVPSGISLTKSLQLKIYDILGREITTLVDGVQTEGEHTVEWHGTNSNGNRVASGVYFYRLKTESGFIKTQKMVLLN